MTKLKSAKNLVYSTKLSCKSTTPSINPRKENLEDYVTVSMSFTKEQALQVAHQLLHHAIYGDETVHLKADRKTLAVTVTSQN